MDKASDMHAERKFNKWVNNPVLEDYALRYAPRSFRKFSQAAVANSALGGIAFLANFAIGASVTTAYGFSSAFWGILIAAVVIFATGVPIAVYSAKYNVDMDLLTRGSGFGYLGSTLTSLVYATFTFIYFATEGSILAQAFQIYFHIPLAVGYLIGALVVIPLVTYGMTLLSKLQTWTQPFWLILMIAPLVGILIKDPQSLAAWTKFGGNSSPAFNPLFCGMAAGVVLSLISQIGEQVDYLRFMPNRTEQNKRSWLWTVILSGPGWVILGAFNMLCGSLYASYIAPVVGNTVAVEPIQQFIHGFGTILPTTFLALTVATLFVILSQLKIQVTNAYSGSLSWSNFFSRLFHFHPGRVAWLFLQVAIALSIMEAGMFNFLNTVLGFYANVAVAWIGAIVSDLVINKKLLKISPDYIEFKRAHLYNFNPVGFGSMIIASIISIAAYFGLMGSFLQAFSPFLALLLSFVLAPAIALATKGRFYIARDNPMITPSFEIASTVQASLQHVHHHLEGKADVKTYTCSVCGYEYEEEDMTFCPFHEGMICSLCCSLEKNCHDICKTEKVVQTMKSK